MSRRIALVALALVLALTAFGCAGEKEPSEEPSATEPAASEPADTGDAGTTSAEPRDLAYLTGTWTVTTELVFIDNEMMRPAADQPGATWSCVVEGSTMTLTTDQHQYVGTITPVNEDEWIYEATATFSDEDGATWVSTLMVTGSSPAGETDTFSAGMSSTIDSDTAGHLYTARWTVEGMRQN